MIKYIKNIDPKLVIGVYIHYRSVYLSTWRYICDYFQILLKFKLKYIHIYVLYIYDIYVFVYIYIQGLDKIIGTFVKFKECLSDIELTSTASIRLWMESYSFLTSSRGILSHSYI